MEQPNKPVLEHKVGAIQGSAWKNEGQNGPYFTVSIRRFYKNAEGAWKRTKTFRLKDMPAVAQVATELNRQIAALA